MPENSLITSGNRDIIGSGDFPSSRNFPTRRAPRVLSLCSGYEGLGLALEEVLGEIDLIGVADIDPGASKVLDYRFPGVRNYGDISKVDWIGGDADGTLDVDILTAGFP
jgi:DNA (cytosine-5)-methyltransferase 1